MTDPNLHSSETIPEKGEPTSGSAPVPAWLWILAVVLVGWAALYLGMNSGGFQSDVFNASQVSWTGGGAAAGPPDPMVIGKRIYTANCVVCHQADGNGVAGQFPPLVGSEWVANGEWQGDNHLVKLMLNGLQGPVEVKGNIYNNAMPAWKQLKDSEIASVLTYIRNSWGNAAEPITNDYVATIREETADRTEPWTQSALQGIPRQLNSEAAGSAAPAGGAEGGEGAAVEGAGPADTAPPEGGQPPAPTADASTPTDA
ncbi:MAG: cytochrome c [Chthoniobacterales bacterium]